MRSPQKSLNLASVTPELSVIALLEKSKPSQKETKLAAGFGLVTGFELHPSIKMLMMRNAICFIYVFIFMLLIFYSSHGLSRTFLFSCWCIAYMGWTFVTTCEIEVLEYCGTCEALVYYLIALVMSKIAEIRVE